MDNLVFAFNALAPLLLLALLGYVLRRKGVFDMVSVGHLNRYIFVVALPVLIFNTISQMGDLDLLNWSVVWFSVIMITIVTLLANLFLMFQRGEASHKPVVSQAFFRGNFVLIGIPLAMRLGGAEALGMIALLNAFMIPITNTFSILIFQLWQTEERFTLKKLNILLSATLSNPLMIAIFLGLIAFLLQSSWSAFTSNAPFVTETLGMIGMTATPLALVAIGGQFYFKRANALIRPILTGVIGRVVLVPLFVLTTAYLLRHWIDFGGAWPALIAIFASPVAVASVAVTKGFEGDDELASQLVVWTTSAAVFSLFVIVVLFRGAGLL